MDLSDVKPIVLENKNGCMVEILPYGATITKILVPDREGRFSNCVLSYDQKEDYKENSFYFGVTAGRCANRIDHGTFKIDKQSYTLETNEGSHHLHGGYHGFSRQLWTVADQTQSPQESVLILTLESLDGDQGYPGSVFVTQKIILDHENQLQIHYEAKSSKATPLNLTNHSYFNLSGDRDHSILDHKLTVPASYYQHVNDNLIPVRLETVQGTPFDFTKSSSIGDKLKISHSQTDSAQGFDHSYLLDKSDGYGLAAELSHPQSGRKMSVWTTKPAMQVYSGNYLNSKGFKKHTGLCLETQYPPNYPNVDQFKHYILRAGEIYKHTTVFAFSIL